MQKKRILLGVTGSIDIIFLPQILKEIKKNLDCTITVLMSDNAVKFLSPETLSLWADYVIAGESPSNWPREKPSKIVSEHDIMLVLPATANTIANVAHGATPNRLATVILASNFQVLFFPAMGEIMWNKPAMKRNIIQLQEDGYEIITPVWHESYDTALGKIVRHPSIPSIEKVIDILIERLSII
ncbi:flavoprotein [Salmonella enterica]|nr:flavoprotein [Salmonella enterica]EBY7019350.1 flavoprotein [Salmonella enterica subsp. enterica serovar Muenchen]EAA9598364.1 flavoprotein [Salmonella enterica]EAO9641165.1 flavoprotein [Salmonella enterica]EFV1989761.1 flavoprotein [Salmonella enterica]